MVHKILYLIEFLFAINRSHIQGLRYSNDKPKILITSKIVRRILYLTEFLFASTPKRNIKVRRREKKKKPFSCEQTFSFLKMVFSIKLNKTRFVKIITYLLT
ncbi:unnamed protein product [Coffea canephora]|uniref:Uncharacterized protein n=1 Tax=Coffea canephora TaxID=49390 RepID=A0A068UJY2_COFCA|nr:unnamed protein product [Coffea canephora]